MFTLNVAYGAIAWVLAFNKEEDARGAVALLAGLPAQAPVVGIVTSSDGGILTVRDDYGQEITCKTAPTAILFEDLAKSRLLQVEYRMHQHRIQSDVQKRAQSDPSLRASAGPAILSPMPASPTNGRGF